MFISDNIMLANKANMMIHGGAKDSTLISLITKDGNKIDASIAVGESVATIRSSVSLKDLYDKFVVIVSNNTITTGIVRDTGDDFCPMLESIRSRWFNKL